MSSRKFDLMFLTGLAALSCSTSVFAQTAPEATSPPESTATEASSAGFEEIIVTARRREESQQSVPQSISTVTGDQIERQGLRSTEDLRIAVPGISISGQRRDEAQFFIRGQGPGPIQTGQRNFTSVATYFAEVPASIAGPGVYYDLQSVQVLKGPQGTLFGRNTTGGAVLFEPRKPAYENGGYAKLTLGNYDYKEFEGVVNVAPVPDKIAIRLAGQVSRRDGYTKSIVTGQDLDERNYEALRASVRINPNDNIESLTIFDYRWKDQNSGSAIFRAYNAAQPFGGPIAIPALPGDLNDMLGLPAGTGIPLRLGGTVSVACLSAALPGCPAGGALGAFAAAYNGGNFVDPANGGFFLLASTSTLQSTLEQQQALGPRRNLVVDRLRSKALDLGITNKTSIDLSDTLTLKNIAAFRKTRKNEAADYDGTPLPFINQVFTTNQPWATGNNQFTEELQLQGDIPSANASYVLGAYYERVVTGFDQYVAGYILGDSPRNFAARVSHFKDTSKAVFAHAEWNPSSLIGLSGGIRQTWDDRFVSYNNVLITGDCNQINPSTGAVQCPLEASAKFDALSYDATIQLKPMDRVLVYGSYRHGYKSGGVNLPTPVAPPPLDPNEYQTFGPESVDSFEIGLKADWDIGIPLRTNLALFYDKYRDMQIQVPVPQVLPNGSTTFANVVRNIVQADNKGFEFEGTIIPFEDLTISGFVSYLDAAPDQSVVDPTTGLNIVTAGRQFALQPKWTYGLNGVLTLPLPEEKGKVSLSANWMWRDKVFNTNFVSLIPEYPSFSLVNARLDWTNVFQKNIDLGIFVNNLTNELYIEGGYPIALLGFDAATYGEPRTYGVSLKINFGER